MTLAPSPTWAQCHIEVHEAPGWLDDCFRSTLWTKFRSADSESFANANDIAGDYATMAVTEGDVVNGCGWQKDIIGLALNTSNYPSLRVRLRGRGTSPQYQIEVEMSDSTIDASGWCDAPTGFEARTLNLTPGKTVKYVRLYARFIDTPRLSPDRLRLRRHSGPAATDPIRTPEVDVELQHTIASSGFRVRCWHDILQGVTARSYTIRGGLRHQGLRPERQPRATEPSSTRPHGSQVQPRRRSPVRRLLFAESRHRVPPHNPSVRGPEHRLWVKGIEWGYRRHRRLREGAWRVVQQAPTQLPVNG